MSNQHQSNGLGPHILLVEDNAVNQDIAVRFLNKLGVHAITVAENGQVAVDLFKQASFCLILMDCQMPILDGYEATRAIRELEKDGHRTPIVAMTAHAKESIRDKCLEAGMDDFLSKPFRRTELEAIVQTYAIKPAKTVDL